MNPIVAAWAVMSVIATGMMVHAINLERENNTMTEEATIFVTLGAGAEFGMSDHSLFLRLRKNNDWEDQPTIDLGPPTRENFERLISNMKRLECHLEDTNVDPQANTPLGVPVQKGVWETKHDLVGFDPGGR
jgi:hypothetical protein